MGQVSRETNLNPPSGRLRYNLGGYISRKDLCSKGTVTLEKIRQYKSVIISQEQV